LELKGGEQMPTVIAKETEPFEITLKRFKKKCEKAAILSEIKKHQAFEKPSVARKRKENAARRKMVKLTRKMERYS
jgi:small subunit ribosomal protein S21